MNALDYIVELFIDKLNDCIVFFSILKPILSVVLDANDGPPIRPIMSVIADLPCGCRPQFTAPTKSKSSESKTLDETEILFYPYPTNKVWGYIRITTSVCLSITLAVIFHTCLGMGSGPLELGI